VKEDSNLADSSEQGGAGLSVAPEVTANTGYAFAGWALKSDPTTLIPKENILTTKVRGDVTYIAVYAGLANPLLATFYTVTFDAGGTYGNLAGTPETSTLTIVIPKGAVLRNVPGFSVPAVTTMNPDFTFVGWSPVVDLTTPVNENRTYVALYAYTPDALSEKFHTVRFDAGAEGVFRGSPITSFLVQEGEPFTTTGISSTSFTEPPADIAQNLIQVLNPDFTFVGWSPSFDPDTEVWSDRVYTAQYAYTPSALVIPQYTDLIVVPDPPDDVKLQALGYDGYYDGKPHGIRVNTSESTYLVAVLSFFDDPVSIVRPLEDTLQIPAAGAWKLGLPPDETNVIKEDIHLAFAAMGHYPADSTRSVIIRPRPLVPTVSHTTIEVGDAVPLRFSYALTMGYDDKKQDGSLIGDGFIFEGALRAEFDDAATPLRTTYLTGDLAGSYPIYAKAGVYGNYEIYEGTDGVYPFFAGWRLAGVLEVVAPDDDTSTPDTGDSGSESSVPGASPAKTGDSSQPLLWALLMIIAVAALITLPKILRRRP
jgi:hypothetical protein